jgi:hypothetical protein
MAFRLFNYQGWSGLKLLQLISARLAAPMFFDK